LPKAFYICAEQCELAVSMFPSEYEDEGFEDIVDGYEEDG